MGSNTNLPATKRPPGRPREFDRAKALHAAMLIFWQHGYEAASLTQLTEAMGISRPTLYAAFGDKERLFREAVVAYIALYAEQYRDAFARLPTARAVAERWLRLTVREPAVTGMPSGCLLVQGALVGGPESEGLRAELAALRNGYTMELAQRFKRAREEGDLPAEVDPATLAEFCSCLGNGIMVQSASGIAPETLMRVVDLVMARWPDVGLPPPATP